MSKTTIISSFIYIYVIRFKNSLAWFYSSNKKLINF